MEKSFIFDSVLVDGVYDRQYLSSDFCGYFSSFIGNGIFPNPSTNLQVIQNENLDVAVLAGKAFINGRTYHNTDKLVFTLDVADGVLNRIDTVVVQVNHLAREIKTVIKKGTFAVNPIPPELTNDADFEEIQLAKIYVKAGAIKITDADITDTRLDSNVCGIVHGTVDQVDTSTLFKQYQSWYEQETGKAVEDMEGFKAQFQSDLITWFEGLKSILDDNAATNLLNLINEVKDGTYTKAEVEEKLSETATTISEVKENTYTKAEVDNSRTYTLTHTKTGTTHTLTELPTVNGIYQCQFKAVADYAEGDTFQGYTAKPSGEDTTLPDKAFVKGDLVSVVVDTENKKLGFKIGGGGSYGTLSPQIKNFTAKAGNHEIKLTWVNPSDSNFAGTYIVRKQGSAPQRFTDGTRIDVGKATSYTDTKIENDKLYYHRAFPYNAKKQVQTELTGAVVSATPKFFSLPVFTGQHAIFGNETKGRIEMYSSGTLTLDEAVCDLFVVGGGGGGVGRYGAGGGGGYTKTSRQIKLQDKLGVQIGTGGDMRCDGNTTLIGEHISANGGTGVKQTDGYTGGNGGSGGGSGGGKSGYIGGNGGSNGSDGESNSGYKGGTGQNSTTRAFGESNGTLYAGGGGGDRATGGSGGGGDGGQTNATEAKANGVPNTGGGGGSSYYASGAGGSGIAIVRWGY